MKGTTVKVAEHHRHGERERSQVVRLRERGDQASRANSPWSRFGQVARRGGQCLQPATRRPGSPALPATGTARASRTVCPSVRARTARRRPRPARRPTSGPRWRAAPFLGEHVADDRHRHAAENAPECAGEHPGGQQPRRNSAPGRRQSVPTRNPAYRRGTPSDARIGR